MPRRPSHRREGGPSLIDTLAYAALQINRQAEVKDAEKKMRVESSSKAGEETSASMDTVAAKLVVILFFSTAEVR